jgi:hypothetical protein
MWACAENPGDFETLEELEKALHIVAENIRTRLDKS